MPFEHKHAAGVLFVSSSDLNKERRLGELGLFPRYALFSQQSLVVGAATMSARFPLSFAAAFAAAWLATACGGAMQSDLFGGDGGTDSSVNPKDAAVPDATDAPDATGDASVTDGSVADATPADAHVDVKPLDAPVDGPVDAKADATDAKVDAKDSSTTISSYDIWCGGDTVSDIYCWGPSQTCCASYSLDGGVQFSCKQSTSSCGFGQTPMLCDGVDDCVSGNVCCFSGASAVCTASDKCTGERLCDPSSSTTQCQSGYSCKSSTWISGVYACRKN